jgi:Arc/MetJ-type ribon-helix-helix transcriptional regulator
VRAQHLSLTEEEKMPKTITVNAKLPQELFSEIEERVRLGLYVDESEVISMALKKTFAEEAREFLRELAKNTGISETDMIEEWQRIRK